MKYNAALVVIVFCQHNPSGVILLLKIVMKNLFCVENIALPVKGNGANLNFSLVSLGCPKNMVDSERMVGKLVAEGFEFIPIVDVCDFVILNTCGFLLAARNEARNYLNELMQLKAVGRIKRVFVTGCWVNFEHEAARLEFPEVDAWIAVSDEINVVDVVRSFFTTTLVDHPAKADRFLLTPQHVAYLRIADGCNRFCSYCAIPYIRGRFTSEPRETVLAEAARLIDGGTKELIVIAQETNFWGSDLADKPTLASLLKDILNLPGRHKIRVMYTYPVDFTDELLDVFGNERIFSYIDLPLQHANDTILQRMNRRVTKSQSEELLQRIRTHLPDAVIRASFIAGFPGETDAMFGELLDFVRKWKFERGGSFAYSREPGTAAAKLDGQLPDKLIQERTDELLDVQQRIIGAWDTSRIGKRFDTILDQAYETPDRKLIPGVFLGRTFAESADIDPVVIVSGENLQVGDIIETEIVQTYEGNLIASAIPQ